MGPLFTDLYELTMAASYFDHGLSDMATFSLFTRDSQNRNFYVAAGLEDVLRELEALAFMPEEIEFLRRKAIFSEDFLSFLSRMRFTGEVVALPEGTICFAEEPILEVTAPIIEAQIIETLVLNTIGFQTLIASKAARCVHAAQGKGLIDFGLRRTQGRDAGLKATRSMYIAGFAGTSNLLAGQRYDIPVSGTMAHSYVEAFGSEGDAFKAYAATFPQNAVFLIDTYDTVEGARTAAQVGRQMRQQNAALQGVRLDSGDMATLSRKVRQILDQEGLPDVAIYASSGFDEFKIDDVLNQDAPIDAFGVGTRVGVSADAPFLDVVYKMVRFKERDVKKLSPGKVTLAGAKQLFRATDADGQFQEDVIGIRTETLPSAHPMLVKVMEMGKPTRSHPTLPEIQKHFKAQFAALPERYKSIREKHTFPVNISPALQRLQQTT